MGERKQKVIPGSYLDIVRKSKKINPEGYRREKSHGKDANAKIDKWLEEEELKHADDPEPDFGA